MLELDAAEFERERDQVGKAQLRAGEVVPPGRGVLGGDAIGRNLDTLHLLPGDVLLLEDADERLDRRLNVSAARIGLDVAMGDAERHGGRECNGTGLLRA